MRNSILTAFWILSVVQIIRSTTTESPGTSQTLTTTYLPYTTTAPATSTARITTDPTYLTSNWYLLSSKTSTNRPETMKSTVFDTYTTTYPTTRPYETTVGTPWPTRDSTHGYSSPSRTTEPVDRTNYGTQSTHAWYDTTTSTSSSSSSSPYPIYTRESTTHDYVPKTTGTTYNTDKWYTTTPRQNSSGFFPTDFFDKIINLQPFKNLKVRLAKNVILRTTTNFSDHQVRLSCPNYAMNFLATELHGDTLIITTTGDCDVIVQSSQFERLDFGAVQIVLTENNLNGSRLSIVTGGQSTIYLSSIHYDAVDVMMFGENHLVLSGSTRVLDVTQLGTGAFDSRQLISDTVQVFSRNSGLISVKSTNLLSLFVSKIANIIWCSPQIDIKADSLVLPNSLNILKNC